MFICHSIIFLTSVLLRVLAVPPSICRAEFRWDDCGKPPKPVMYYWKQGSRCEVGIWKGCLPNPNMFSDEYECINTCVFQEKPIQRDPEPEPDTEPGTTESGNTDAGNATDTTGGNGTVSDASDGTPDGNSTGGTDTTGTDTTVTGGTDGGATSDATGGGDTTATGGTHGDATSDATTVSDEIPTTTTTETPAA